MTAVYGGGVYDVRPGTKKKQWVGGEGTQTKTETAGRAVAGSVLLPAVAFYVVGARSCRPRSVRAAPSGSAARTGSPPPRCAVTASGPVTDPVYRLPRTWSDNNRANPGAAPGHASRWGRFAE